MKEAGMYRGPVEVSGARGLGVIAVLDVLAVAIGLALEAWWETLAPVSVAVAAVGVITFFGLVILLGGFPEVIGHPGRMRGVLTAAFTSVFFVLLGLLAFFQGGEASELGDHLVTSLTYLMGVIIAFYFGATTYERVKLGAAADPDLAKEPTVGDAERQAPAS
jgi:hypothetical protein